MTKEERDKRSNEVLVTSDLILYLSQLDASVLAKATTKELVYGWFDKRETDALKEVLEGDNALKDLKEVK